LNLLTATEIATVTNGAATAQLLERGVIKLEITLQVALKLLQISVRRFANRGVFEVVFSFYVQGRACEV
jgi:hypothetical protein